MSPTFSTCMGTVSGTETGDDDDDDDDDDDRDRSGDGLDWRHGKQMMAEWLPGSKHQNGRCVFICLYLFIWMNIEQCL